MLNFLRYSDAGNKWCRDYDKLPIKNGIIVSYGHQQILNIDITLKRKYPLYQYDPISKWNRVHNVKDVKVEHQQLIIDGFVENNTLFLVTSLHANIITLNLETGITNILKTQHRPMFEFEAIAIYKTACYLYTIGNCYVGAFKFVAQFKTSIWQIENTQLIPWKFQLFIDRARGMDLNCVVASNDICMSVFPFLFLLLKTNNHRICMIFRLHWK